MRTSIGPVLGMPMRRADVYSMQVHKCTNVTSQEELVDVVRKNNLDNSQSECENLKFGKNNLIENVAHQDKILEE